MQSYHQSWQCSANANACQIQMLNSVLTVSNETQLIILGLVSDQHAVIPGQRSNVPIFRTLVLLLLTLITIGRNCSGTD